VGRASGLSPLEEEAPISFAGRHSTAATILPLSLTKSSISIPSLLLVFEKVLYQKSTFSNMTDTSNNSFPFCGFGALFVMLIPYCVYVGGFDKSSA
jgi:hypothetical protein